MSKVTPSCNIEEASIVHEEHVSEYHYHEFDSALNNLLHKGIRLVRPPTSVSLKGIADGIKGGMNAGMNIASDGIKGGLNIASGGLQIASGGLKGGMTLVSDRLKGGLAILTPMSPLLPDVRTQGADEGSSASRTKKTFGTSGLVNGVITSPNIFRASKGEETMDVVEFGSVEYLCNEVEPTVVLTVVRRGPCTKDIKLTYGVVDKENEFDRQGNKIFTVTGMAALLAGESSTEIKVAVVNNPSFTVERLFDASLNFVNKSRLDTVLGDIDVCRIVVLNNDKFPGDNVDLSTSLPVIVAFIKHNYNLLKNEAHWGLVFKLAPGIAFVINQTITQKIIKTIQMGYLVRSHNDGDLPSEYQSYLYLLGGAFIANFLFVYCFDIFFARLKLGGKAKNGLRVMCMDTCSQLTPAFEEKFDTGRIIKILDHSVETAVDSTWMTCFTVYASTVKLVCMFGFMFYTIYEQATLNKAPELMWLMVVPFVFISLDTLLFFSSYKEGAEKNHHMMVRDDEWGSFVAQASFLRPVITTFRQGFAITGSFRKVHMAYNLKAFEAATYSKHVQYAANMIPTIIATLIMVNLGKRAMVGQITVGAFIVFMNTINAVGPTIGDIFMGFFDIGKGTKSIVHVAGLLNADTRRKMLLEQQLKRNALLAIYKDKVTLSPTEANWDPNHIIVSNVSYSFKHVSGVALPPISFRMEGGQLVALKGSGSIGKKIILRLMARHFVPTDGFIYYPSRWRYRFMDSTPLFFGGDMNKLETAQHESNEEYKQAKKESMGTLEYNLKFGSQFKHPNAQVWDIEIFELLQKLRVSEDLIGTSSAEFIDVKKFMLIGLNGERLSQTNRALLTLARALLSSVDLLLISNVLDNLGPELAVHIMGVLKELTTNRSLSVLATEHAKTPIYLKKMKTVIFSTKLEQLEALADNWIGLEGEVASSQDCNETQTAVPGS